MNGLDVFIVICGIYLLVSFYFIKFKDIQVTILSGVTYRDVRLLADRTILNKKLSEITLITGIVFVVAPLMNWVMYLIIYEEIIFVVFIYYIISMCLMVWNIKKGKYN